MDINNIKKITKTHILYACLIIICLIIIRCLYIYIIDDKNIPSTISYIEKFSGNTIVVSKNSGDAIDLLTKIKSNDVQTLENINTNDLESQIKVWSTKIYNIQNLTQQMKTLTFYKPKLIVNGETYCKLGDVISQNTDYSPPSINLFSLLVKKSSSKIKSPKDFQLVVDMSNPTFNPIYYDYINYINDISTINNITPNLTNCANAFINLNGLIQNNIIKIQSDFKTKLFNTAKITIGVITPTISSILNNLSSSRSDTVINNINSDTTLKLPAGFSGSITSSVNAVQTLTPITISQDLDIGQQTNTSKDSVFNKLPLSPFGSNLTSKNIEFYSYPSTYLFSFIPIASIINYLKTLCSDIKTIYNSLITNTPLLTFLKLTSDITDIDKLLIILNNYSNLDTNNNYSFVDLFNDITSRSINTNNTNNTNTVCDLVLNIMFNMKIFYNLSYVSFTPNLIKIPNTVSIRISNISNDIISNIPSSTYKILTNTAYSTNINNCIDNLSGFSNFLTTITASHDNPINFMPLQIYKPIAPDGYVSLGHVFCNYTTDLKNIRNSDNVACVPDQCVKIMRPWLISDKVFEYNDTANKIYWAIFFNPYTGTFESINNKAKALPDGNVCKVIACVDKCTVIDELEKADKCSRDYYNLNKELDEEQKTPNLVSDQEEKFYLAKIKAQSDSIAQLQQKTQKMQMSIDKATIINREMNKNKLKDYVDTQKKNIDIIMKRLEADKNKIDTNINMPSDFLKNIQTMVENSPSLPPEVKTALMSKLENPTETDVVNVLQACPQYDLTGLVKKTDVANVCYGCDIPT